MNVLESNIEKIKALCLQYKVRRLFSFGSVNTNNFKSTSDIDLIVDFENIDVYNYADNYFDLKFTLEKVLNRKIDLLEEKAISNPFLKESIEKTKKLIYG